MLKHYKDPGCRRTGGREFGGGETEESGEGEGRKGEEKGDLRGGREERMRKGGGRREKREGLGEGGGRRENESSRTKDRYHKLHKTGNAPN